MHHTTPSGSPHNALHSPSIYDMTNMQCGNIASRTNGAGCIYTEYAHTKHTYHNIPRIAILFEQHVPRSSLVPGPFPPPVFDRFQYKNGGGRPGRKSHVRDVR